MFRHSPSVSFFNIAIVSCFVKTRFHLRNALLFFYLGKQRKILLKRTWGQNVTPVFMIYVSLHKKCFPLRISIANVWIWSHLLKKSLMENLFFVQYLLILCRNDLLESFVAFLITFQEIMKLQSFKFDVSDVTPVFYSHAFVNFMKRELSIEFFGVFWIILSRSCFFCHWSAQENVSTSTHYP